MLIIRRFRAKVSQVMKIDGAYPLITVTILTNQGLTWNLLVFDELNWYVVQAVDLRPENIVQTCSR